jgi:predicted enzyme related to lactoylglutathione lyase
MAMTARMVTLDCADPDGLASWWAAALDGTVQSVYPGWFAIVSAQPISLGFQKVPEDKVGKNRVHVDFSVDDRDAAVRRLAESGATMVGEHSVPTGFTWTVMRDPAGNEFCVATEPGG